MSNRKTRKQKHTEYIEKYGDIFFNVEEFEINIKIIDNVQILGSAIYSKWRYFNHWAYSGSSILEPENKKWFIIALTRLAELTKE